MIYKTVINKILIISIGLFISQTSLFCNNKTHLQLDKQKAEKFYQRAIDISVNKADSSLQLLLYCKDFYEQETDTVKIIDCLLAIINIHIAKLNLSKAYDNTWEALLFAENYKSPLYLAKVYESLGTLYSYFSHDIEAESYLKKSLSLFKTLNDEQIIEGQTLISSYYNLVMLNNKKKEFHNSIAYLDTCFMLSDKFLQSEINRGYLTAEKGYILMATGHYNDAEKVLLEVKSLFENLEVRHISQERDKGYLVKIYLFLGMNYQKIGRPDKAVEYYKKGLQTIDLYNAHLGIRADILRDLAMIYYRQNRHKEAFESIYKSKELNDEVFGSRSNSNIQIFEIKNRYREEIRKKNEELSQKNLELLKKEDSLLRIRILLIAILLGLTIVMLIVYNRNQGLRFRTEKELITRKAKIKQESAREMLELKNKELTAFTLQFIEKEKIITELLAYIKENPPKSTSYTRIAKSVDQNTNKLWEEFNQRFLSVNQGFYERLREKFPKLSPTDLKHCALIKLNFSGKEMAQLLAISTSSVHISRHRLRKKMNLDREVSLSNFIASI